MELSGKHGKDETLVINNPKAPLVLVLSIWNSAWWTAAPLFFPIQWGLPSVGVCWRRSNPPWSQNPNRPNMKGKCNYPALFQINPTPLPGSVGADSAFSFVWGLSAELFLCRAETEKTCKVSVSLTWTWPMKCFYQSHQTCRQKCCFLLAKGFGFCIWAIPAETLKTITARFLSSLIYCILW